MEERIACPFCGDPLENNYSKAQVLVETCKNCNRRVHLPRLFWTKKGAKIDSEKELRCPHCNKMFGEGEYSDRPQTFKCKACGNYSVFQRL